MWPSTFLKLVSGNIKASCCANGSNRQFRHDTFQILQRNGTQILCWNATSNTWWKAAWSCCPHWLADRCVEGVSFDAQTVSCLSPTWTDAGDSTDSRYKTQKQNHFNRIKPRESLLCKNHHMPDLWLDHGSTNRATSYLLKTAVRFCSVYKSPAGMFDKTCSGWNVCSKLLGRGRRVEERADFSWIDLLRTKDSSPRFHIQKGNVSKLRKEQDEDTLNQQALQTSYKSWCHRG